MHAAGTPREWYEEWFNEDYLEVYANRDRAEAEHDVAAAVEQLELTTTSRVLDLCCGFGRHLEALERRDIRAYGLDRSAVLLERAAPELRRRLICGDMLRLPFRDGSFDGVTSFFTSFGYFSSDAEHSTAVREIARVLRAGGRLYMDILNGPYAAANLEPRSRRASRRWEVLEERDFNPDTKRIRKHITILDGDARREYVESVRVFDLDEMASLLSKGSFRIDGSFGDTRGTPYTQQSPRMIIIASQQKT